MGFQEPAAERAKGRAKHSAGAERRETGRLEALSDGVFAIAMTLLVLGIPIPSRDDVAARGNLFQAAFLAHDAWLSLAAYVVSFLAILAMWVNHHYIFQFIARVDRAFVILNGLLLMVVVFVNYPTALVANFIGSPGGKFAAVAYNITLIVIAILYNAMWYRIILDGRLLVDDADPAEIASYSRQYLIGGPLYVVAFALAFFSPIASVALDAALVVYWTFTGRMIRVRRHPVAQAQAES